MAQSEGWEGFSWWHDESWTFLPKREAELHGWVTYFFWHLPIIRSYTQPTGTNWNHLFRSLILRGVDLPFLSWRQPGRFEMDPIVAMYGLLLLSFPRTITQIGKRPSWKRELFFSVHISILFPHQYSLHSPSTSRFWRRIWKGQKMSCPHQEGKLGGRCRRSNQTLTYPDAPLVRGKFLLDLETSLLSRSSARETCAISV